MQKYLEKKSQQKQKKLDETSPMGSEKSSKSSMRKTPGKPPKSKQKVLRADITARLGMSADDFKKIPNIDPFVNKMIMNEIIPKDVKKTTRQADETFGRLLNVAREQKNVDYEDGVYFVMPKDPRGI